ncbi:rho guanine nucleotide exchange factor 15-like [Arapaima gigas]
MDNKGKPLVEQKPLAEGFCSLSADWVGIANNVGRVKNIVEKFSQQCGPGPTVAKKQPKRAPTVKPKPARVTQMTASKSHLSQHQAKGDERTKVPEGATVTSAPERQDRRQAAPDGKEVEGLGAIPVPEEEEWEPGVTTRMSCEKDCGCVCHLKQSGMRLIWVPESEAEDEEEDGDNSREVFKEEDESEEESEKGKTADWEGAEDMSGSSGGEEKSSEGQLLNRAKFHHVLDYAIRRRISDVSSTSETKCALTHSPSQQAPSPRPLEEDECIYDDVLELAQQPAIQLTQNGGNKEAVGVKQQKLTHLPRLNSSAMDANGDYKSEAENTVPPAIPPRVPINQDKQKSKNSASLPRGILLPQPSLEEWRALRLSPPLMDRSQGSVPPLRPPPQPPSPLLPHTRGKDPPARSSPDGSSLSAQSASSLRRCEGGSSASNVYFCLTMSMFPSPPPAPPRKTSRDWKSQFQDEPLYQTYRATVITKEIRRQTVCRNISKTSADYNMEWGPRKVAAIGAKGSSSHSTLWQELPEVRDRGILENMSPTECYRQESMFEVLTSEASYLRSLHVLTDHFMESRELNDTLIVLDKKILYSNILRIREVSERFLMDLEDRVDQNVVISDICDIIHYHAQHHFPAYIDYVRNQIYQEKTYTNLMQTNQQFATVIARLQESPQSQRLPFTSFLLLPFQRITRIKMLIEIIDDCNTEVGKMKRMEELIQITNMLEFEKLKAIPIISQNRFLEKRGEVQEVAKGNTLFNLRPKFTPIFLFLFNDLLILAIKKSSERYVVIDHTHRSLVQVHPISDESSSPVFDFCFCLTLLENHQGRINERLLKAPTQSDMDRWIAAFPNSGCLENETDEVVYEDWDCPQVHCIEQYVAEQADELSLEPMDIINILCKTNEGWYEGIRLSDKQKGWFPVRYVQEITNEHVRRRNLRDRYRLVQAAHATTKA